MKEKIYANKVNQQQLWHQELKVIMEENSSKLLHLLTHSEKSAGSKNNRQNGKSMIWNPLMMK